MVSILISIYKLPLVNIIQLPCLLCHLYADDILIFSQSLQSLQRSLMFCVIASVIFNHW